LGVSARVREAFSLRRNARRLFVAPEGHLRPLDGLRALSVLWVVLFHAGWYARFSLPPLTWLGLEFAPWMLPIWRGDFGVDLFFVLSGFLIAGMLLDEQAANGRFRLGRFYIRRLLRLWPALLVVAVVELFTDDPHRLHVWANVLGWTWSLAIEEQFYLVCPWLLRAVAKLSPARRMAIVVTIMFALVLLAADLVLAYQIRPWDAEIVGSFDMRRWGFAFDVFYDKPWMRAGALLAGVLAAMIYRAPGAMTAIARGGGVVVVMAVVAVLVMTAATHWPLVLGKARWVEVAYLASFRTMFGVAAAFLVLLTVSDHPLGRALAIPLSSPWLYPISQLAYAAYLINPIVTLTVDQALTGFIANADAPMPILIPCDLLATFACATLIHLAIERPGMELRPR
jgi:peptidoglycan/LPS O-acetylase OafA/YrhL